MNARIDFFGSIRTDLDRAKAGSVLPVDERHLLDILPPHWRDDAETPESWFLGYARAFGLHATYDPTQGKFNVRKTIDAEDEATIAIPARTHAE